jgi:hypothetical protein
VDTPTPEATPYVTSGGNYNVNVRSGPGTDYPRIGRLGANDSMAIIGKTPDGLWWQVCCVDGQTGWVSADVVKANGPLENVPIPLDLLAPAATETVGATATPTPQATETPAAAPLATGTPVAALPFAVEETKALDNEASLVIIWAAVYRKSDPPEALSGYRLRVLKNGTEVALLQSTEVWRDSAPPGFPNVVKYNVEKFEAPLENATWAVYVIDGSGNQISPAATFETAADNPKREFYVAYVLK